MYESSSLLKDAVAERAVLANIFNGGSEAYDELANVVTTNTFTVDTNQALWKCAEHICKDSLNAKLDFPTVMSAAQTLGFSKMLEDQEERKYIRSIMNMPVHGENARKLAAKIRKLEVARALDSQVVTARDRLHQITGNETIDQILNTVEGPLFDFTSLLNNTENKSIRRMGDGLEEYLQYLMDNPRQMMGIPTGLPMYDIAIGGGLRPNSMDIIAARPKTGKAQPLDATVQTPAGPVRMGDIRVGDRVCTPEGTSVVRSIHPQGNIPIYRVYFSDGDFTECCLDHLWEVKSRKKQAAEILPLREIAKRVCEGDGRPKWSVRLPFHCHRDWHPVPIEPYLLGVLLGDGGITSQVTMTNVDAELIGGVGLHLEAGYEWKPTCEGGITYALTKGRGNRNHFYMRELRKLGLMGKKSGDKFIPEIYKNNDYSIRVAILQGLMDTDGSVGKKGVVEYSSKSKRLADDVKEIVQSLGGLCTVTPRTTTCNGKTFPSFRCIIKFNDPSICFRLSRKLKRCRMRKKPPLKRTISQVMFVGSKPAQCIKLDDDVGLYLTDNFIVTHNTMVTDHVSLNVAGNSIPVLNLDTEMSWEEHGHRIAANVAGVPITDIERGVCGTRPEDRKRVLEGARMLKDMPYDYATIQGWEFEDVLAHMRRWVLRTVGINPKTGKANPCVIIYDYLKLMSADALAKGNMAEFQVMGFIATALKNFAGRYGVPILTFAQLNRDGIDKEDTSAISQSDRIIWFCTSFSIFKWKTKDEKNEDPSGTKYTHKLIPIVSRHGEGLRDGDYINISADYSCARIKEGLTLSQIEKGVGKKQIQGMVVNAADEPVPFTAA